MMSNVPLGVLGDPMRRGDAGEVQTSPALLVHSPFTTPEGTGDEDTEDQDTGDLAPGIDEDALDTDDLDTDQITTPD